MLTLDLSPQEAATGTPPQEPVLSRGRAPSGGSSPARLSDDRRKALPVVHQGATRIRSRGTPAATSVGLLLPLLGRCPSASLTGKTGRPLPVAEHRRGPAGPCRAGHGLSYCARPP